MSMDFIPCYKLCNMGDEKYQSYEYILDCAKKDVINAEVLLEERESRLEWLEKCKTVETKELYSGFLLDFKVGVGESKSSAIIGDGRSKPAYDNNNYDTAFFYVENYFFTDSQKEIITTYLKSEYNVKLVKFVKG